MAYFLNFNSYYHITPPTPPLPPPIPSTYPFFWKTEGAATAKFGGKFKKRKREKLILETRENKFWKGPKLRKKWLNVKNLTEQFHVSIFSCAFYSWIMVFIVPSWFKNDIKKNYFPDDGYFHGSSLSRRSSYKPFSVQSKRRKKFSMVNGQSWNSVSGLLKGGVLFSGWNPKGEE